MLPVDLITKLIGNLATVVGNYKAEQVQEGYTVTFDLAGAVRTLALNLAAFIKTVNADTTVGAFLGEKSFLGNTLKGLLSGIKASEALALVLSFMPEAPEEVLKALPVPGETEEVYDYLVRATKDTSLLQKMYLAPLLPGVEKLEDATLTQLVALGSAMGGEPVSDDEVKETIELYVAQFKKLATEIEKDPLSAVYNIATDRVAGYVDPENADPDRPLMKVEAKTLSVTLKFDTDKKFTGLDGVAGAVSVKTASGDPSEDDLEFDEASATLTVVDSHTYTNLSGIHFVSDDPDRTKFKPCEESTHSDSFTIEELADKVDCSISLTVTETQIIVKLSPSKSNDFAETIVTIDVSEFPADKKPTEFVNGSMWAAKESNKSAKITFTNGDETVVEAYLVVYYTDEYKGVNLHVCLNRTDDPDDHGYYLCENVTVEFPRLSGVIA